MACAGGFATGEDGGIVVGQVALLAEPQGWRWRLESVVWETSFGDGSVEERRGEVPLPVLPIHVHWMKALAAAFSSGLSLCRVSPSGHSLFHEFATTEMSVFTL